MTPTTRSCHRPAGCPATFRALAVRVLGRCERTADRLARLSGLAVKRGVPGSAAMLANAATYMLRLARVALWVRRRYALPG